MSRAWPVILSLLLLFPAALRAQEEDPDERPEAPPIESEWIDWETTVYTRGDKIFTIALGTVIPAYFSGVDKAGSGLSVGGMGSLSFNYFLSSNIFVGGELSGMFSGTRGGNMLYIIPMGVRIGYQFVLRRFEIPVSLMAGAAPQKYLEQGYLGPILKPGVSAFWRFNPEWSFGLNAMWWFIPQWPKDGSTAYGNFAEVTICARYHF
jgi:hypothetical protein